MVVCFPNEQQADRLFHALADSTRRDILRRAIAGELSVSALAAPYAMSFAAVQKHVTVLERAGLVTRERRGREHLVRTNAIALRRASELLDQIEQLWRARLDQVDALVAEQPGGDTPCP